MLNWISGGALDISAYFSSVFTLFALLIWFLFARKDLKIKTNWKILIEIILATVIGAALSPFVILLLSGTLVNFFASFNTTIKQIDSFSSFMKSLRNFFRGFSLTGGFLVLSIAILFVINPAKKLAFSLLYPFPLITAVLRLNCFSQGCCFGKLYKGIFAVTYPPASNASKYHYVTYGRPSRYIESLPVHPTQLYIVFAMILLFFIAFLMNKFKVKKNIILGTIIAGYGLSNFIIEFLRVEKLLFDFVTIGQLMETALFCIGIYTIFGIKEEEISVSKN